MSKRMSKKFTPKMSIYTLLFILFLSPVAYADLNNNNILQDKIVNIKSVKQETLNYNLQYDLQLVDPLILAETVSDYKQRLIRKQLELTKLVKRKQFNKKDTLISLVMPGGFIYAGIRLYEQKNSKKMLSMVSNDINELSYDLSFLSVQVEQNLTLIALSEQLKFQNIANRTSGFH